MIAPHDTAWHSNTALLPPTPSKKRRPKIADLIHRELAMLLRYAAHDPRLVNVSITAVDLSPDFSAAQVYYTLLNAETAKTEPQQMQPCIKHDTTQSSSLDQQIADFKPILKKATQFLRSKLAKRTALRRVPALHFQYDRSILRANQVLALIKDC